MKKFLSFLMIAALLLSPVAASADILKKGSSGDEVVKVQERLIELDFYSGEADGVYDQAVKEAIYEFQMFLYRNGVKIEADGCVGDHTSKYLFDDRVITLRETLRNGDKGSRVKAMQKRLIELGLLSGKADGVFGSGTENSLKAFQRLIHPYDSSVTETGVLDSATRTWLYSDLSSLGIKLPAFFNESDPLSLEDGYLYTTNCILLDADTGEVLYERDADAKIYPASTTKIMTLLLACENAADKLERVITVPEAADEVPSDSSKVPVHAGEKMPFKDLLYGLMINSGNDAANAIAVLMAKSPKKFAAKMNERAEEIGMDHTHYVNPHGYHNEDHYTTARDMAQLTFVAIRNDLFREIASATSYTMAATSKRGKLTLKSTYLILDDTSVYYYPYAWGIKTGTTKAAGNCYIGGATKDGHSLIAVVMNSGADADNKWVDARHLYQYGFAVLESR